MESPAEVSAGLGNVTDFIKPSVGDATQAVEVPSTEMRDELRFRVGDRGQLGLVYDRGFASTSKTPDPTQAPVKGGDVEGYGVAFGYSIQTSIPALSVGLQTDLMVWSLPYVQYQTCTDCDSPFTVVDRGRANPLTLGLGVTPSYKAGRLTYFGGVYGRNHPTTKRKDFDVAIDNGDNDVESGPFNVLLEAGVSVELSDWLSGLVVVHQDLVADPVQYGPGIGVGVTMRLGGRGPKRAAPVPVQPLAPVPTGSGSAQPVPPRS
jgi:hypothetical protein